MLYQVLQFHNFAYNLKFCSIVKIIILTLNLEDIHILIILLLRHAQYTFLSNHFGLVIALTPKIEFHHRKE